MTQSRPPTGARIVLILGAGEILESHLMRALSATGGYQPILLSGPDVMDVADRLHSSRADAVHPPTVPDRVDCVINCMSGSPQAIHAVTSALIGAARRHPPRRIIHVSSMSVYGNACGLVDETTTPVPPLNGYMRARLASEELVRQYAVDGGDAVILRPSCIIGPDSEAWVKRIARLLTSGRLGDLGAAGDGVCNLIGVDDLVSVILAMLGAAEVSGEVYNVSASGPALTWNQFLLRFARAIGATPIRRISARRLRMEVTVVAPLLRAFGMAARRLSKRLTMPDALTPSFAQMLQQDITLNTDKLANLLQRDCPPVGQQIELAAQSWRSGWLERERAFPPAAIEGAPSAGTIR